MGSTRYRCQREEGPQGCAYRLPSNRGKEGVLGTPLTDVTLDRMELATVRIDAVAESPGARLWRHIWGALLRESGF